MEEMEALKSVAELEEESKSAEVKEEPKETAPEPKKEEKGGVTEDKPVDNAGNDVQKEPPKEEKSENRPKDGEESPYGKPGHTPDGVQKRINSLTKRNYDLESEVKRLKAEMESFRKRQEPQGEPTREDFLKAGKTEDDYIAYKIQKGINEGVSKALESRGAQERLQRSLAEYQKREDEARSLFEDYDAAVYDGNDIECYDQVANLIRDELANGPEVVYTLHKNPNMIEHLKGLDERGQVAFVRDVSARLLKLKQDALEKAKATPAQNQPPAAEEKAPSAPQQAQKPNLREPAVGNGGKPVQPPDLANCSMEEFERFYGTMR
jgi:predicted RNase H-like nuclease (RuvC/YqgF family)